MRCFFCILILSISSFIYGLNWDQSIIGYSVNKNPVRMYRFGDGDKKILILGGFHGSEVQGTKVAYRLIEYLTNSETELPGRTVYIIPEVNPDGLKLKRRTNAHGIDLNRNFPTLDWRKRYSSARYRSGRKTPEPETRIIMSVLAEKTPVAVVSIHAPHDCINFDGPAEDLADYSARFNHYPVRRTMGYTIHGSFGTYAGKERGIPVLTLELPPVSDAQAWSENKEMLLSVIAWKGPLENQRYQSVLIKASRENNQELVKNCLDSGMDPNVTDELGWTPLIYASYYGNKNTVEFLIEKGARVNQAEKYGWTALHAASARGYSEIVKLLLDKGADLEVEDRFGDTAFTSAARNGYNECLELIIKAGGTIDSNSDPILYAARNGYYKTLQLLVKAGSNINCRGFEGRTPLLEASYFGYPKIVSYLISSGADLSARDSKGRSALDLAKDEGNRKVVLILRKAAKRPKIT